MTAKNMTTLLEKVTLFVRQIAEGACNEKYAKKMTKALNKEKAQKGLEEIFANHHQKVSKAVKAPKAVKGKRKKKDKDAPKAAKSAYIFHCVANRPVVKRDNPDIDNKEVTRELGAIWTGKYKDNHPTKAGEDHPNPLSDEDKQEFVDLAAEDKERARTEREEEKEKKDEEPEEKKEEEPEQESEEEPEGKAAPPADSEEPVVPPSPGAGAEEKKEEEDTSDELTDSDDDDDDDDDAPECVRQGCDKDPYNSSMKGFCRRHHTSYMKAKEKKAAAKAAKAAK